MPLFTASSLVKWAFTQVTFFKPVPVLPDFGPQVLVPSFWLFPLLDLADRQCDILAVGEDVQLAHPFHQRVGHSQYLAPLGRLSLTLGRSMSMS